MERKSGVVVPRCLWSNSIEAVTVAWSREAASACPTILFKVPNSVGQVAFAHLSAIDTSAIERSPPYTVRA